MCVTHGQVRRRSLADDHRRTGPVFAHAVQRGCSGQMGETEARTHVCGAPARGARGERGAGRLAAECRERSSSTSARCSCLPTTTSRATTARALCESVQVLPPADNASVVAQQVADAVRRLADVADTSDGAPGLNFPGDVYLALGFLARAQRELPVALQHLSAWLLAETVAGRVEEGPGGPYDGDVRSAVEAAARALDQAGAATAPVAHALTQAQLALRTVRQA